MLGRRVPSTKAELGQAVQVGKTAVYIYADIPAVTGSSWNNAYSLWVKDLPRIVSKAHEIAEVLSFENYI